MLLWGSSGFNNIVVRGDFLLQLHKLQSNLLKPSILFATRYLAQRIPTNIIRHELYVLGSETVLAGVYVRHPILALVYLVKQLFQSK
ncbi:hypothetical protein SAMN05421863_101844 [Nitrosomonas communis]|uniref:Uncharacterized protein n=1 Tax=Nitrosomonas communis TaxID=44574 RepID=A0A1I4P723_9PROT|nr:hypothetical protein SAMN05421863_101844 [Nitrosomonas communis]